MITNFYGIRQEGIKCRVLRRNVLQYLCFVCGIRQMATQQCRGNVPNDSGNLTDDEGSNGAQPEELIELNLQKIYFCF